MANRKHATICIFPIYPFFPFFTIHLARTSHSSFSQFIISSSRSPMFLFPFPFFFYYSIFEIRIDIKRNQSHSIERLDYYGSAAESATWLDEGDNKKLATVCKSMHASQIEHFILDKWTKGTEDVHVHVRKRRRRVQYQLP